MFYKFFCFMFFVLFTLATPFVYHAHAHDEWPADEDLGGSVYAGAHGSVFASANFNETSFHVHCIGFAHWDRAGNYTVSSIVKETNGGGWGRANYQEDDPKQGRFTDGVRKITIVAFTVPQWIDLTKVDWSGSATVEDTTTNVTKRAFVPDDDKWRNNGGEDESDEHGSDEDIEDANNDQGSSPTYGIANNNQGSQPIPGISVSSDQTYQPGDSITLNLVTSDPYYQVDWYVHTPWDTSSYGTYQQGACGDGTSTETSFSYTFPSGSMHTGDFTLKAVIFRWSDMSWYGDETYTVTVE